MGIRTTGNGLSSDKAVNADALWRLAAAWPLLTSRRLDAP